MGRREKVEMEWRYPFSEEKLFVLTITAGLEGYHISVDGRHISSFAYRTEVAVGEKKTYSVKNWTWQVRIWLI